MISITGYRFYVQVARDETAPLSPNPDLVMHLLDP